MEHAKIVEALRLVEKQVVAKFSHMPGVVDFAPDEAHDTGDLADGVHRLDGSQWQFVVENGEVRRAVRDDMKAFWSEPYTAYANDDGDPLPTPAPAAPPKRGKRKEGAIAIDPLRPEG